MCNCSVCKEQKSSDPPEDSDSSFFFCKACSSIFCLKCVKSPHLDSNSDHISQIYYLCDDCEIVEAPFFCTTCGQNLCSDCDARIHNKGKRAQHSRETRILPLAALIPDKNQQNNEILKNNTPKALVLCSQNFFKDLEKNIRILIESRGIKYLFLLILEVMKDEKASNFEKSYENALNSLKQNLSVQIEVLKYSFEKHAKNKLKSFIKTNPTLTQSRNLIETVFFVTTNIKYLDLQILEEIYSDKNILFSSKTILLFIESLIISNDTLPLMDLNSQEQMKQLEAKTFEEISKTTQNREEYKEDPLVSKSQTSIKNPNASFQFHMNASASSFESSALFMPNMSQNPLNHSFGAGNLNISAELLHSVLNNSFDPSINNKSEIIHKNTSPYMPYFQKMREIELKGLVKLGLDLQRELHILANEGDLLIPKVKFLDILVKLLRNSIFFAEAENVLREAEQINILHVTLRKFEGYPERQEFISLNLDYLSLESLTWVLKSIRKDAMTPTEKIILSRIKECFKLKITPKQWEKVLLSIKFQKFSQESDPYSTLNKPSLPLILLSKIKDPLIGNETNVLKFKGQDWTVEDQGKIEEDKDLLWKTFINFLNSYFKIQSQKSKLEEIPEKVEKTSESEINYNENSLTDFDYKGRHIAASDAKYSDETKAIPGGRYGCAQFIKTCAPEELRKLSLGRLNLYVQEAINKGFIKYHRTLLVKDYSRDEETSYLEGLGNISGDTSLSNIQRDAKIKALQKTTLEILKENPSGVSLAQIPQFLKLKAQFPFNLQELGFPKLKNFLASMPEKIKIEMAGTNNSYAYLADLHEENANKNINVHPKQVIFTGVQPANSNLFMGNSAGIADKKGLKKKFNTLKFPIVAEKMQTFKQQNRKKVSSLEEYLNKVINLIYSILIEHNYGLTSDKLYSELCKKLGVEFDFRLFNCPDFYAFLVNFLENMIDIECKKSAYFIYPKDFRFGPLMNRKKEPSTEESNTIKQQQINPNMPENTMNAFNPMNNNNPMNSNTNNNKQKPNFTMKIDSTPFNYNEKFNKNGLFAYNPPPMMPNGYGKFNTINNMINFNPTTMNPEEDFYSMHKKSLSIANYGPSLYKSGNLMQHPMFNLSPNGNLTSQGNSVLSPHTIRSPSHNRNISYWNINGPNFDPVNFANNGSISVHSRNDSKNTVNRKNEESNIELNENLRFIEELLADDQDPLANNNVTTSFLKSGSFSTNVNNMTNNFNLISAIKPSGFDTSHTMNEKMHSKALSDDFNDFNKQRFDYKANINKQHGRVQSNLEKNKIKDDSDEEREEY